MPTQPSKVSDEAIFNATGAPWSHWLEVFSLMDAKSLPHKEIALKLHDDHKVPSWWCQMLTVKFEQEIGRRQPGDSGDGFSAGVSITLDGELDAVYGQWKDALNDRKEFHHVAVVDEPALSQTENWRYWKIRFEDGTRVNVNFSQKAEGKVLVQVTHEKLSEADAIDHLKQYWKSVISDVFPEKL